ncbi:SusF/SusE family outer membrane protein [Mangrovimonas spongiae]|uniref:SusF/SusE family outer membrane protein n=1 Tax=Mangrovimonas spongiae TaxID=2494697 RepID=A0A3R9P0Z5_9FLAO|nr:SusF/SusE family outer membrane protein [Mangrovimonas spongiae]RSK41902.1 SusF/SusE family outer membrane protein [Mangrovimonas spongiae]
MKKIKILTLLFLSLLGFYSCQDDDNLSYIAQPVGDFSFTNSFSSEYVLTTATSSNLGERFTWDNANFDVQTNVSYDIQKSITGDFSDMEIIGTTSANEYAVTIGDLLNYAEEAGLDNDPDTEDMPDTGEVYFRVRAYVGSDSDIELTSESQALTLVLIGGDETVEPVLKDLYLVGDATAPGWSENNNNPAIIRHADNENMYTFRGYFVGGGEGFKLLEVLGQWQPQWGVGASTGEAAVNDGTGSDPTAFPITDSGYYEFTLDTDAMTYTLDTYDASAATDYTTIGIIGDATVGGWDADTDMTQSTFDPHIWYMNDVEIGDGEMKFRAENDWATNWGNNTPLSGFGTLDGANIPVTAGIYNIWFNDLDGGYILIPVE